MQRGKKMKYRRYTKKEIIETTRTAIHLFIDKKIAEFTKLLDENFIFIGDMDVVFLHGIGEFLKFTREERELPPAHLSAEKYEVVAHERHLWVTSGQYEVYSLINAKEKISKHHFTFVWKQINDDLKLIQAMACHVEEISSADNKSFPADPVVQVTIFKDDQTQANAIATAKEKKLAVYETNGNTRYIAPSGIVYIEADNKLCHVHTVSENFTVRHTLTDFDLPELLLVHKSYRVNKRYIKEICRYEAKLLTEEKIPIGKSKYMQVKNALADTTF